MTKEQYAERLASSAWKDFAYQCKQLADNQCEMCGSGERLNCHHMRYRRLGTAQEWLDIAVVCEPCHIAYHKANPYMPTPPASRLELLNELAISVSKKGRDVDFYHRKGDARIEAWIARPVIVGGLIQEVSAGKAKQKLTKPKPVKMHQPQPKKKKAPLKKLPKWRPPVENFTPIQAKAFIRHNISPVFDTPQFKEAYGITNEPPNWQRLLVKALRRKVRKPLTFSTRKR